MEAARTAGALAAARSTAGYAPQARLTVRARGTLAVSRRAHAVTVAGLSLWLVHGLPFGAWPPVAADAVCPALSASVLPMEAVAEALDPTE